MNSFTYENQGTNTYLVYHIGADETIDSMGLGMITNNSIPGLAQTMCIQMDMEKYIKYNVSAKISVRQFFSGPVNKARLLGVFNGIVSAMISAEDYMIDPDMILLDLDYIFADVSTCATVLVCLPVVNEEKQHTDLGLFFKNIMFSTQFDQTENCDYVAQIMNHLNSMPVFSLADFKKMLDELMSNPTSARKQASQAVSSQGGSYSESRVSPVHTPDQQPPIGNYVQPIANDSSNGGFGAFGGQGGRGALSNNAVSEVPSNNSPFNVPANDGNKSHRAGKRKGVENPAPEPLSGAEETESDEKPMSMFYLLQHYNKENKAIYDAQQAAKKKNSSSKESHKKSKEKSPERQQSFNIPGGSDPGPKFAIPGQQTPPNTPPFGAVPQPQQQAVKPIRIPDEPKKAPVIQTPPQPQPLPVQDYRPQPHPQPQPQPANDGKNYGATVVLNGAMSPDTTVLNAEMLNQKVIAPHLVRKKNGERIPVNKPVFRIGKEKSYVDYFIGDNSAISRSHANIITRDGKYFVVDTNSTNHTYLDGSILQSNSEYEIKHSSKLRFANEDFDFLLY